jgi:hypothetical protein
VAHVLPHLRAFVAILACIVVGSAQAFQWTALEFPSGDQGYTVQITSADGVSVIDVDMVDRGGTFDVTTAMTFVQTGVARDDLSGAMFGGRGTGHVRVRSDDVLRPELLHPADAARPGGDRGAGHADHGDGFGTIYMEREEVVAGRTCVVIRMELDGSDTLEFAVAEGLPIPCFSRYGSGSDAVEARLVDVR